MLGVSRVLGVSGVLHLSYNCPKMVPVVLHVVHKLFYKYYIYMPLNLRNKTTSELRPHFGSSIGRLNC